MPLPSFARILLSTLPLIPAMHAQSTPITIDSNWQMQDVAKVPDSPEHVSTPQFHPQSWYRATVPGTVLTTLVDNKVYPDPLYGENMRAIPESLNKTSYWYRTTITIPADHRGRHTWLNFGGINYSSSVYVNGHLAGTTRGAFARAAFDISEFVTPGKPATLAVLVAPQPHPGIPHEHTQANGVGKNGGITALDGPTFLSTIGWDWIPAIRDRDTGIWLPVTLSSSGPVQLHNPFITAKLDAPYTSTDLTLATTLTNLTPQPIPATLHVSIAGPSGAPLTFDHPVTIPPGSSPLTLDPAAIPALHITSPALWWPNGYGPQNLYRATLTLTTTGVSDSSTFNFGVRKIDYQVADSENLTLSVNGVKVMARGGNWGLDDAMKRVSRTRLDAQFHMHALANLNIVRNWVGQSTSPDFYEMADKYGILLWDEFFQPNPSDGPDPADIPTYLANVSDKVLQYRNHPAIAVWCARNEGYPPKSLDDTLKSMMATLDPTRLYQSNSADGRGVSSHGPYYWRSPRFFYALNESFKTETGSVSVPTIESIQGMMPQRDWETINDDWAQHDMAKGAQRGDEYPFTIARRYGPVRNLADFVRKAQLANYEAFRAMYEGRNAQMFTATTGVLTWMSHPAQPSFVWQLYHYDLEPNASLYAALKASESIHVQLNEANRGVQVVNNLPHPLTGSTIRLSIYRLDGTLDSQRTYPVPTVPPSTTLKAFELEVNPHISEVYFVKLDLTDSKSTLLSTNLYWQNVADDDFTTLATMPTAAISVSATPRVEADNTILTVTLTNPSTAVALMTHLQLHRNTPQSSQQQPDTRVLPVFYSDNYLSLAPNETRTITIQAPTASLAGSPAIQVDGFNIALTPTQSSIPITLNQNAQPTHWPPSSLVPTPPPTH